MQVSQFDDRYMGYTICRKQYFDWIQQTEIPGLKLG